MSGDADTKDGEVTIVTAGFGQVFDRGLVACLDNERDMRLLRSGLELRELEAAIAREPPHLAVLGEAALIDSSVPGRLRALHPDLGVVALLPQVSELRSRQLLAFGATACIPQETAWSDISAVIRFAAEGKQVFISAGSDVQLCRHRPKELTPREREVLPLLQDCRSNAEIARALQIGMETVRSHVQNIKRKLEVTRRSDLLDM